MVNQILIFTIFISKENLGKDKKKCSYRKVKQDPFIGEFYSVALNKEAI